MSETGCIDTTRPLEAAPGLIPYAVASPLWSDGAVKERFFLLPEAGKIHVKDCVTEPGTCAPLSVGGSPEDEGHWELPVGSVVMKTFTVSGKRIETRLLMRARGAWLGFSYEWNGLGAGDTQTDATLLPDAPSGKDLLLDGQTWHFPSRVECLQCHTREAGRSLGLSTQQLNRDIELPGGTQNQLTDLIARGVFDAPPAVLARLPDPKAPGDLTARARSYLHVNCAICHRPGGSLSDIDLRWQSSFAETGLCQQPVVRGGGEPGAPDVRLVPGSAAESALSFRMHATDFARMPKIGSSVIDGDGVALIDMWIGQLPKECPQ